MNSTDTFLKELKQRLERATPGPWEREENEDYWDGIWLTSRRWITAFVSDTHNAHQSTDQGKQVDANMELIANATADLKRLIAMVECLREGNAEVVRNSHDILAKKNCSRAIAVADAIAAGKEGV